MSDKISIVVPVFNIEGYVERCLQSLLRQTYTNLEVLAIDDGSTDSSGEILDRLAVTDSRIKVIHKENGGVTSARMAGIRNATGEWIGFVDGDDETEPDMFEHLISNAITYNADISHCGYQMCFEDGRIHYFYNTGLLVQQDKITALKELLSGSRIEPSLCNKLFHKTLFQSLLHSDTVLLDIKINEDLLMNYMLFSAAKQTVFEDWCPYHYIVRKTSASRGQLTIHKIYDPIKVKEIIRRDAPTELQKTAKQAYINTCINTYHTLLMTGADYKEELHKVHSLLAEEADGFLLLGRKRRLMANMITFMPTLYRLVYVVYSRFFRKISIHKEL